MFNLAPLTEVHLDLDGVVADFDKRVESFGLKPAYSGSKAGLMWNKIESDPNFYYKLDKMPDADHLMGFLAEFVLRHSVPLKVLTAIPSRRKSLASAEFDKKKWVAEKFSPDIPVNIGPYSKDKYKWAGVGKILIDDRVSNIDEWHEAGGIGILHTSAVTTIEALVTLEEKLKVLPR